jgi:hypothetical protein
MLKARRFLRAFSFLYSADIIAKQAEAENFRFLKIPVS